MTTTRLLTAGNQSRSIAAPVTILGTPGRETSLWATACHDRRLQIPYLAPRSRVARRLQSMVAVKHAGFTLVEMMVTVAIIGVLAAIAVPAFVKTTRKTRGAEAHAVFAELRQRQEEYHLANGTYFSTGINEADIFPATPGKTAQSIAGRPASWTTLKLRLPNSSLYCGYVAIAGTANSTAGLGAKAAEFGLSTAPRTDWYYLLARCNLDGSNTRDSYYFTWINDTKVQKQNEGY
jgi:prepilin-type N-terminal cleavage/methylation domain-containing protein